MDKKVRELLDAELANLKAKVVLEESQLAALQTLVVGEIDNKVQLEVKKCERQLRFDKLYVENLENKIKEDK